MRKKGFTLIELLVVIAIIAMLMAILMPALSKVKKIAMRVVCGTNLKGLGTAQTVYANDYDDDYAVQGRKLAHTWSDTTDNWDGQGNTNPTNNGGGGITVGASLYLLVREADVSPKSFVCPASTTEEEFSGFNDLNADLIELYDFGSLAYTPVTGGPEGPAKCVSYAYHNPYEGNRTGATSTGSPGRYAANGTRSASFAMMADRNPFLDDKVTIGGLAADYSNYLEVVNVVGGSTAPAEGAYENVDRKLIMVANAVSHEREGQNILFGDGHSSYENRPDIGVENDSIYTQWTDGTTGDTEEQVRRGQWPGKGAVLADKFIPQSDKDSALVNDAAGMTLE